MTFLWLRPIIPVYDRGILFLLDMYLKDAYYHLQTSLFQYKDHKFLCPSFTKSLHHLIKDSLLVKQKVPALEMHLNIGHLIKNRDKYYHSALKCLEVSNPTSVSVLFGRLVHFQGFQLHRKMVSAAHSWLD